MHTIRPVVAAVAILALGATVAAVAAQPKQPVVLEVGEKAPSFRGKTDRAGGDADKQNQAPRQDQNAADAEKKPHVWKSKDHVGKKILVVYFYPADMTPGCTRQACSYRDALAKLKRNDVEVVGVSGDTVANHRHFRQAYDLNYTLLADPKGKIAKKFGVKQGEGATIHREIDGLPVTLTRGVTASRWTFVIGPDNTILYKDASVNPSEDAANVLKVINKIPEIKPADDKATADDK